MGGINLYGYAAGDPVNLSDPLGLWPSAACIRQAFGAALSIGLDIAGAGALKAAGKALRFAAEAKVDKLATVLRPHFDGLNDRHIIERVGKGRREQLMTEADLNARQAAQIAAGQATYRSGGAVITSDDLLDVALDFVPIVGSINAVRDAVNECRK